MHQDPATINGYHWRGPKGLWAKGLYRQSGCDTFQYVVNHIVFIYRPFAKRPFHPHRYSDPTARRRICCRAHAAKVAPLLSLCAAVYNIINITTPCFHCTPHLMNLEKWRPPRRGAGRPPRRPARRAPAKRSSGLRQHCSVVCSKGLSHSQWILTGICKWMCNTETAPDSNPKTNTNWDHTDPPHPHHPC